MPRSLWPREHGAYAQIGTRETVVIAGIASIAAPAMVALAWRRAVHSLAGELIAAIALPGASAPIAVAAGVHWQVAVMLWVAWAIGYACSVVAVHRVALVVASVASAAISIAV